MVQTVIFDMDGVIVDTEPVHHFAYYQHFKELSIEVSDEMYVRLRVILLKYLSEIKSTVRFAGRCRRFNLKKTLYLFNEALI